MKISIITVTLNRGFEIERTIQSVLNQTYSNIDYWIIDGGSTDETLSILKRYKLQYISEKDEGIYHAMNKGIRKATGDFILFLNAGDYFFSDLSLRALIDEKTPSTDIIFGNLMMVEQNHRWEKQYPDQLTFNFFRNDFLPHPATLIRKSLFELTGLYNENNRIVSDWEFFIHAVCKFNANYKHVNNIISVFHMNGISSINATLSFYEKKQVLEKHYSRFIEDYVVLDNCRTELQHLKNSRLHTIVSLLMRSSLFKSLKKIVKDVSVAFRI